MPIVRRGLVIQYVHFITARAVNGILNESKGLDPKVLGRGSAAYVLQWKSSGVLQDSRKTEGATAVGRHAV